MKNIFISSTFIDMQAERDLVQERVLPALRDEARKYGDNVGVIDLRWGVDTSTLETEEGAAKVLQVCLDEIDRSHPYMLIFLGERYGTMMREDQIEKSVRGREDKYTTDDYVKSITALEVEYGALSEKYGELNHCVVCFREPVVHMLDGAEKDLYAEHTEEGKRKLEALKERIKQDLGEDDRLISYSCTWDKSTRQLVDFTSNGQSLENVLTNCFVEMFRDDWKEYESLSWQDKEQLAFRALMESKLRSFVGREALLEEYYQSAVNGTCPIILQGEVGSGKTAIMCKLVERLQKEGKNAFAFFSGAGSMSTNAESLVKQMVYYMENLLGVEEHFGEKENVKDEIDDVTERLLRANEKKVTYDDWTERLGDLCFRLPEGEKVYFCIDALDQLFQDEHVEKLDFFARGKNAQVVASCTDEFELPMEAMVKREVKQIPTLSEEDAKMVAEGILASYSRNAYASIEKEILKKKSIGNPLYISLLIQRLNMMDMEELRQAMTEEEIVALGTGIIREMPEETEKAIVAVIRNGIDKISESKDMLYEVLEYLAVSRNGLRMSDLQGVFVAKGGVLPVLDITLLMKYLDSFFYVHEDDRIDFTHKAIRQGLLMGMMDREVKEETIKEHLKTLDAMDELYIREAMYFARIREDVGFANKIIMRAYVIKESVLINAIKEDVVENRGVFYCRLIENEVEKSLVHDFFLWHLSDQLGLSKEEMHAQNVISKTLVVCLEDIYKNSGSESSLRGLSNSYDHMGNVLRTFGQTRAALLYYEKGLLSAEKLYEELGDESSLNHLIVSYHNMGAVLRTLGQPRDALTYYEKMMSKMECFQDKTESETFLDNWSVGYYSMGHALKDLGQAREALSYYEKALKYTERRHERVESKRSLREVIIGYQSVGSVLKDLGRANEALMYYEKGLKCAEILNEKLRNEESLHALSISYMHIGEVLRELGEFKRAFPYSEKALAIAEELHKEMESEVSLQVLSYSCHNMGHVLQQLGQLNEAQLYYEKGLKCAETLNENLGSEASLRDLSIGYDNMGDVLIEMGRPSESLSYYQKALECTKILYNKSNSNARQRELSVSYNNMGHALIALGRASEALEYYKNGLVCVETQGENSENEVKIKDLSVSYSNIGRALNDLGQTREALVYYQKSIECKEDLYDMFGSVEVLQELLSRYTDIGKLLNNQGQAREALLYYKKGLVCAEKLYMMLENDASLQILLSYYEIVGHVLIDFGQIREAVSYYEKALKHKENLYERSGSETLLQELIGSYHNQGNLLRKIGQPEDSIYCYEKSLKYAEMLHEKVGDEKSLQELSIIYYNVGRLLQELDQLQDALLHYEKSLKCVEVLYEKSGNETLLKELSICYNNMGGILWKLRRLQDALPYYEKSLKCAEVLHEKIENEESLNELLNRYNDMDNVLTALGRFQEAVSYQMKALRCMTILYKE